jgi:hypothetical protein
MFSGRSAAGRNAGLSERPTEAGTGNWKVNLTHFRLCTTPCIWLRSRNRFNGFDILNFDQLDLGASSFTFRLAVFRSWDTLKVSTIDTLQRPNLPQVLWSNVRFPTHVAVAFDPRPQRGVKYAAGGEQYGARAVWIGGDA